MVGSIHWRQLDIADPQKLQTPVTVIGAGAIGSEVVKTLAKVGFGQIEVFDDDMVEEHNLPNQFYRMKDIGKPKVEALKELVMDFTEMEIEVHNSLYIDQPCRDILIVAVDSMDVRIAIYNHVKRFPNLRLLIDGRMGGEFFSVNTVDMSNPLEKEFYEKTLYSSEEAESLPCTAKAIMYTVGMVSGMIVNQAKRWSLGQKFKKQIDMDIPNAMFYTV